jgi:thioredoxin-related protein
MKFIPRIVLILGLIAIFNISYADEVEFTQGSYQEVLAKAKAENKVVMIDFVTDWCKWCIETDNKVYKRPDVYEFANTNQINWKIDAEKGEGPDLAEKYKVKGYPTIIFVDGDGNEIDRIYGYIFADEFLQKMKDYNSGANTYASLKTAVESTPEDPVANWKFAEKLISYGDYDEAKPYLEKVISLDAGNSAGYTDDAKLSIASSSETPDAIVAWMSEYPGSDKMKDAYVNAANMYASSDFNKAKSYFDEAYGKYGKGDELLDFNYGLFLYSKAYSMMKSENADKDKWNEGLTLIDEAMPYVAGSVNEASAYYVKSELYYLLGDKAKANDAIDMSIKLYDKKVYREQKDKINGITQEKVEK